MMLLFKNTILQRIVLLTIGFCLLQHYQVSAQADRFQYAVFTEGSDSLNYRILYPPMVSGKTYPLVLFLHGSGERGNDNEKQLHWSVTNFATDEMMIEHPAFVLAPQCPEGASWANFGNISQGAAIKLSPNPTRPMELVIGLIHELAKKYPVDKNRIYITGLSMGGFGTYDALERYPDLFAAGIPVAGGGDVQKAGLIAKIPLWNFHGAEDNVVPLHYSQDMIRAIEKDGGHPGNTVYPETGHFSWLPAYKDPMVIDWLFRQRKD